MSRRREFVIWVTLAVAAMVLLVGILMWQYNNTQRRWAIAMTPRPAEGGVIFRAKGCANCHGNTASGGKLGPRLRERASLASLPQLVTAMWNHAPHMYEAMRAQKLPYPTLDYDETGQLVAYLYMTGYADEPGDPENGRTLFESKQCVRCHSTDATKREARNVSTLALDDGPISWTQALWNHASAMQESMHRMGIAWPRFQANELRDLFAYVRRQAGQSDVDFSIPAADPDRGWKVFQAKSCMSCHALSRENGPLVPDPSQRERPVGPVLGADGKLPPTFSQFGEAMLNHFPDMRKAMNSTGKEPPTFQKQEMADLAVFLYSLHYREPSGSPHVGTSIFAWRGCAECHGEQAEGTSRGPRLRGLGRTYTATRLATDLWRHGSKMYEQSRKSGQAWPTLQESDVGDLLSFLNTPVERGSGQ